jgi:hypothetical protein
LLVGIGKFRGIVLEYKARIPNICEIVAADANAGCGFRKTNSAIEDSYEQTRDMASISKAGRQE